MSFRGMILIGVAAVLTAVANLLLRGGVLRFGEFSLALDRLKDGLFGLAAQPLFVFGVIFYALAALVWFSALSVEDLSASYPALVGLTFILVAFGAVVIFHESFSWPKLLGTGMILFGIVVIARA